MQKFQISKRVAVPQIQFSWDFVWVNQDIVLNIFTNFQPVINFSRVKAIFCVIALNCYNPRRGPPNLIFLFVWTNVCMYVLIV